MLEASARIFVAGHQGLVGRAMMRGLAQAGYHNLITRTRAELDLRDRAAVRALLTIARVDIVMLCAAKVGGIKANATFPVEFLAENLEIQGNVISESHAAGIQQLMFLGSSCIYPRECPQPMSESALLTAPLEATNRPYAIAKIAGIELCWAFNRQHGRRYLALMPANLFGPGDNYDLHGSHVLPALIRRMHEAKQNDDCSVTLWGTGEPLREFLYSDDLADAAVRLLKLPTTETENLFSAITPPLVNVGYGEELSIRELSGKIARIVGYTGQINWDISQPDGTPRKLLDSQLLRSFGWLPKTHLDAGIRAAYEDFLGDGARR